MQCSFIHCARRFRRCEHSSKQTFWLCSAASIRSDKILQKIHHLIISQMTFEPIFLQLSFLIPHKGANLLLYSLHIFLTFSSSSSQRPAIPPSSTHRQRIMCETRYIENQHRRMVMWSGRLGMRKKREDEKIKLDFDLEGEQKV